MDEGPTSFVLAFVGLDRFLNMFESMANRLRRDTKGGGGLVLSGNEQVGTRHCSGAPQRSGTLQTARQGSKEHITIPTAYIEMKVG